MKAALRAVLLLFTVGALPMVAAGQKQGATAKPGEIHGTLEVLAMKIVSAPSQQTRTNCYGSGSQINCNSTTSMVDELSFEGVFSSPDQADRFVTFTPVPSLGQTFAQGAAEGGGTPHVPAVGVRLQPGKYEAVLKGEDLRMRYHYFDKHGKEKTKQAKYKIQSLTTVPSNEK